MDSIIALTLLTLILTGPSHEFGSSSNEDETDPNSMPYFDHTVQRNVTAVVGQHAFLLCRVHRMGDQGVSWIRKRDLHILTAGIYTYTTDQRFVVKHSPKSENWTLLIKYAQERDAGVYECQVNTEPKISMAFQLNVIESKGRILGGSDVYVKSGSSLRLTCEVEHGPHDITQVFWYHGANIIDPQTGESSEVRVITQVQGDLLRSQLTILKVKLTDSGNYTCSPTMSSATHVVVHVISGEAPAAMQHGNRSSSTKTQLQSIHYLLLLVFLQLILTHFSLRCNQNCHNNTHTVSLEFGSTMSPTAKDKPPPQQHHKSRQCEPDQEFVCTDRCLLITLRLASALNQVQVKFLPYVLVNLIDTWFKQGSDSDSDLICSFVGQDQYKYCLNHNVSISCSIKRVV